MHISELGELSADVVLLYALVLGIHFKITQGFALPLHCIRSCILWRPSPTLLSLISIYLKFHSFLVDVDTIAMELSQFKVPFILGAIRKT